jgi:dTDP-glucose pyrophosphorylase
MSSTVVQGRWTDAGTFESLYEANQIARETALRKKKSLDGQNIVQKRKTSLKNPLKNSISSEKTLDFQVSTILKAETPVK